MITDNVATKLDFNDLKHEFAGLRSDFEGVRAEFRQLSRHFGREIGAVNDKMDREIGGVYRKLDDTKSELILRVEKSAQTTTIRLGIMMVSLFTFFSSLIVFLNKLNL